MSRYAQRMPFRRDLDHGDPKAWAIRIGTILLACLTPRIVQRWRQFRRR